VIVTGFDFDDAAVTFARKRGAGVEGVFGDGFFHTSDNGVTKNG
jgi:hypothetical protein